MENATGIVCVLFPMTTFLPDFKFQCTGKDFDINLWKIYITTPQYRVMIRFCKAVKAYWAILTPTELEGGRNQHRHFCSPPPGITSLPLSIFTLQFSTLIFWGRQQETYKYSYTQLGRLCSSLPGLRFNSRESRFVFLTDGIYFSERLKLRTQ